MSDFFYDACLNDDNSAEIEREDLELYQQLGPEGRANIDTRWGPPSSWRASARNAPQARNHPLYMDPPNMEILAMYDASSNLRGTGRVLPTRFTPPSATSTSAELFPAGVNGPVYRFIRRGDPKQALIYVDGCCLDNGRASPRGGWAFVFQPGASGVVSARLEKKGPFGDVHAQSSNRAELRAVLGALRFRSWLGEGFTTLVLATDSEYVSKGATVWAPAWVRSGWKTSTGADVKNKDMWEMLLGEAERLGSRGLRIQFWKIPRMLNEKADRGAKDGAVKGDLDEYCELMGVLT